MSADADYLASLDTIWSGIRDALSRDPSALRLILEGRWALLLDAGGVTLLERHNEDPAAGLGRVLTDETEAFLRGLEPGDGQ